MDLIIVDDSMPEPCLFCSAKSTNIYCIYCQAKQDRAIKRNELLPVPVGKPYDNPEVRIWRAQES